MQFCSFSVQTFMIFFFFFSQNYYLKLQYVQGQPKIRTKTSRNMSENGQIVFLTGISQRNHSKAKSILSLYTFFTKNKISKIRDAASSENRQ